MNDRKGERGQLYTSDALLALMVFLFALMLITTLAAQLENQSIQLIRETQHHRAAERVGNSLFSSPGNPSHWEYLSDKNATLRIGLISTGKEISPIKLSAFGDWNASNYSQLKSVMGLGDQNFYLSITDSNQTLLFQAGSSPVNASRVSVVTTPAFYAGKTVLATLQVYP